MRRGVFCMVFVWGTVSCGALMVLYEAWCCMVFVWGIVLCGALMVLYEAWCCIDSMGCGVACWRGTYGIGQHGAWYCMLN